MRSNRADPTKPFPSFSFTHPQLPILAALTNKHVTTSLKLLAKVAADQAAKYDELSDSISDTDLDDDYQSRTPIYDSLYGQRQSKTIL